MPGLHLPRALAAVLAALSFATLLFATLGFATLSLPPHWASYADSPLIRRAELRH
jgi:hypothetical protein